MRKAIKAKRAGKWAKGVLVYQDNAPVRKSIVAMAAVHDFGYTFPEHSPYSPDPAPSDCFLYPNMKMHLAGRHKRSDEEVIAGCFGGFFFRDND